MQYSLFMTKQQWKFVRHIARFVDVGCFHDFKLNNQVAKTFIRFQGEGRKVLTEAELESIKPLIYAQQNKETTIKGCVEDVYCFWGQGAGWYLPLIMDIQAEFSTRHAHKDYIFIRALIKIARSMKKDIVGFLHSYSGFSVEQKEKILENRKSAYKKIKDIVYL